VSDQQLSKNLSSDQQQITADLQALLRERIQTDGPMPFVDYMNACLYEPGLGYYVNGLSKLGADGDFVTAPELSSSFAACVASQIADVFNSESFTGSARDILEFGAGSGQLACDVLKALERMQALPGRYYILDVSGQLAASQQQLLRKQLKPSLINRIEWIQKLPESFSGVAVANEVFDAFPVERFVIKGKTAERVTVEYKTGSSSTGGFVTDSVPCVQTQRKVDSLAHSLRQPFPDGYTSEYCNLLGPWWSSMAEVMQQGLVLVCDYGCEQAGYYSSARSSGTLRCFFRHGVHNDALVFAGIQDITADVDFTALTQAAVDAGFELDGYTPMSQFMLGNNVLEHHQSMLKDAPLPQQIAATGKLKQLLLPQEMGERFMVAGYSVGLQEPMRGFSLADWSRLL
jgi:SAM-dependent MidA family methyltransferase